MKTEITEVQLAQACEALGFDIMDVKSIEMHYDHIRVKNDRGLDLTIPVEGHSVGESEKAKETLGWTINNTSSLPWDNLNSNPMTDLIAARDAIKSAGN